MSSRFLLLVVGLGNPGPKYAGTRHNVGFDIIDDYAARLGISFTTQRHHSLLAISEKHGVVLMKPQTLMNLSGTAVRGYVDSHSVPHDKVVVVADNFDVVLGAMKLNNRGGAGGQNGVEDVLRHLGKSSGFARMKVGIGRPRIGVDPADYVLGRFNLHEQRVMAQVRTKAVDCLEVFRQEGLAKAMNQFNGTIVDLTPPA